METATYVSLSGQLAMQKRLETLAQNIANANTAGYRAAGVEFSSIISRSSPVPTSFASTGGNFVVERAGGVKKTGGSLDVAIQGQAYLSFEGPQGIFYSRDGRLTLQPDGQITSLTGYPILDAGGAQLLADPQGGELMISRDGRILQDGVQRGVIGLFSLDLSSGFTRFENSGVVPAVDGEPVLNFSNNGVLQGYIEESNVNPIEEMVRLIEVTRAFESVASLAERAQDAERSAIQSLASK